MRKLVLGIRAQASGKNLTRPLMPPAATIRPASAPLRYNLVNSLQLRSATSNDLTRLFVWLLCFASGAHARRLNSAPWSLLLFADAPFQRFSASENPVSTGLAALMIFTAKCFGRQVNPCINTTTTAKAFQAQQVFIAG